MCEGVPPSPTPAPAPTPAAAVDCSKCQPGQHCIFEKNGVCYDFDEATCALYSGTHWCSDGPTPAPTPASPTPAPVPTPAPDPTAVCAGLPVVELGDGKGSVCVPKLEGHKPNLWTNNMKKTDMMPTEIGDCDYTTGEVTLKSEWATTAYGVAPKSTNLIDSVPITSTTQYCDDGYGGCTCGNVACNVKATSGWIAHAKLDGVAAIPPRMYGEWSERGEQCITNRNICYELTNTAGETFTVAIVGRCGGYVQCAEGEGLNPDEFDYVDMLPQSKVPGTVKTDANRCNSQGGYVPAGTTPPCNTTAFPESEWSADKCFKYGADNPGSNVDWCGSNMHPHFDLNRALQDRFCGNGVGACVAKSVRAVSCPVYDKEVQQGHLDSEEACGVNVAGFDCSEPGSLDRCSNLGGSICCAEYLPNEDTNECNLLPEVGTCSTKSTCEYSPYSCV